MGITYKLVNIFNGISCGNARTKCRCTNIKCVSAMVYCLAPVLKVLGRSKKFKGHILL